MILFKRSARGWARFASRSPKLRSSISRAQYQLWKAQRNTQAWNHSALTAPSAGSLRVSSCPWPDSSSAAPAATTRALKRQGRSTVTRSRRNCHSLAQISSNRSMSPLLSARRVRELVEPGAHQLDVRAQVVKILGERERRGDAAHALRDRLEALLERARLGRGLRRLHVDFQHLELAVPAVDARLD